MDFNNPLDPFGTPDDDVLSLQSYGVAAASADCVSDVSCESSQSCQSGVSGKADPTIIVSVAG